MNRKELLIRQNDGRAEIGNFISKLTLALGIKIEKANFLDLETTDKIKDKFYEGLNSKAKKINKTYNSNSEENLHGDIELIALELKDQEAYLITKQSEICGAVRIPAIKALHNYKAIIDLDGDSLNLITTNDLTYVHLDYYEEYSNFFYQLFLW